MYEENENEGIMTTAGPETKNTKTLTPTNAGDQSQPKKVHSSKPGTKTLIINDQTNGYRIYEVGIPGKQYNATRSDISGNLIVCRQLSYFGFLINAKDRGYIKPMMALFEPNAYQSLLYDTNNSEDSSKIASLSKALQENHFDSKNIIQRADKYLSFEINKFGEALYRIFESMQETNAKERSEVKLIFDSENHAITMVLVKKTNSAKFGKFVLKFYDPNDSLKHMRVEFKDFSAVKNFHLNHVLTEEQIHYYFTNFTLGMLASFEDTTNLPQENTKKSIDFIPELTAFSDINIEGLLFFKNITYNFDLNDAFYLRLLKRAIPYLSNAILYPYPSLVENYVKAVLGAKLTADQKSKLLTTKNLSGMPCLLLALNRNGKAITMIEKYVGLVLDSSLSDDIKDDLICIKNPGTNGLIATLLLALRGDSMAAEKYLDLILPSTRRGKAITDACFNEILKEEVSSSDYHELLKLFDFVLSQPAANNKDYAESMLRLSGFYKSLSNTEQAEKWRKKAENLLAVNDKQSPTTFNASTSQTSAATSSSTSSDLGQTPVMLTSVSSQTTASTSLGAATQQVISQQSASLCSSSTSFFSQQQQPTATLTSTSSSAPGAFL